MMPSPVCFTSRPRLSFSARRTRASWARTISTARASPTRAVMAVDSTISVNMMARSAASKACSALAPAGAGSETRPRKASTAERSTSITSVATLPCASWCTRIAVSESSASMRQKPLPLASSNQ